MDITNANLSMLYQGFNAAYKKGLERARPEWQKVATRVPSSTAENAYAWLGKLPQVREWIGDRQKNKPFLHGYKIEDFEHTVEVNANDIEDDQYGVYSPLFEEMGNAVARFPNELVFGLLGKGFTEKCYDGVSFFNAKHPVKAGKKDVETSNF